MIDGTMYTIYERYYNNARLRAEEKLTTRSKNTTQKRKTGTEECFTHRAW
jgi:hypothetical protein